MTNAAMIPFSPNRRQQLPSLHQHRLPPRPRAPFPARPEDCFDAADWLVENAVSTFTAKLAFIGGESARAHLSILTALKRSETHSAFNLKELLLHLASMALTASRGSSISIRRALY